MRLDKNTTKDQEGKYALINLRRIRELELPTADELQRENLKKVEDAINTLKLAGVVTFGNEEPGEQFFVMKYKDRFTFAGLMGYWNAVVDHYYDYPEKAESMKEYGDDILKEARLAKAIKTRLPD